GTGSEGPKTYLLLVQNEDELRPSGGFITAVGKLVLDQGRIVDLSFEDSGELDNWSMPYPVAPWQLSQYMNSRVLLLRDANWFPDFPTSALYVEQLYAYTHQNSVNGIVAFDQRLLIMLLGTLGPLNVDGVSYPITADNVVAYMRSAKSPPSGESRPANWTRKAFIGSLANAILNRVLRGSLAEWRSVSAALLQALQQRHLLLQMDDQDMKAVIERRDWNGAVQSGQGDFLLVMDSNIGFNKTNAVVATSLVYDVDLTDLSAPVGTLFVSHTNNANPNVPCIQWSQEGQIVGEASYPIDRCYWDYMRVYVPQGARLLSSTPQSVPASWTILNQSVPPRVDKLEEGLPGLDSFGTLLVVPGGQTVNVSLRFALPVKRILLQSKDQGFIYQLNFKKQPGTLAIPLTLRAHLPANAVLSSASPNWIVDGANIMIQTDLREDVQLKVSFDLR
ncbi:MAG: DUF4012 domain-containing protein, partial [Chloroflexi bacterium]|nr:DUF4012 domain-containing protein [Chloroflexota bacterium]